MIGEISFLVWNRWLLFRIIFRVYEAPTANLIRDLLDFLFFLRGESFSCGIVLVSYQSTAQYYESILTCLL
jgi:hypothetical protein